MKILVLTTLVLVACEPENPTVLRDTSGASFLWRCNADGCDATPTGNTPPTDCSEEVLYSYIHDGFVHICTAAKTDSGGKAILQPLCRLVACSSDMDCPIWVNETYECRQRLCQRRGETNVNSADLWALCLADFPRPDSCAAVWSDPRTQEVLSLVQQSCDVSGSRCDIPASCRSPF